LLTYIPHEAGRSNLPMRLDNQPKEDFSERDILYKVLFDMKRDMVELKKLVAEIIEHGGVSTNYPEQAKHLTNYTAILNCRRLITTKHNLLCSNPLTITLTATITIITLHTRPKRWRNRYR
jgi:hypothetical protein